MSRSQDKVVEGVVQDLLKKMRAPPSNYVPFVKKDEANISRDMLEGWGEAFKSLKSETLDLIGMLKLMEKIGMPRTRAELRNLFPNLTSSNGSVGTCIFFLTRML